MSAGESNQLLADDLPRPRRRRWAWRWAFVASFALLAFLFGPYLFSRFSATANRIKVISSPAEPERAFNQRLKIVCFNIAHGRGQATSNWAQTGTAKRKRITQIAQLLRELDADVVVLNEVDFDSMWSGGLNQAEQLAGLAEYPFRVEQRNLDFHIGAGGFRFGNVIMSRFPIADASAVDYPSYRGWEDWLAGRKRGVIAKIELSPAQFVRVAAVHLSHRSEDVRVQSVDQLLDFGTQEPGTPLILAGDFNSTPTGFPRSRKTEAGGNAMDRLFANGWESRPTQLPDETQLTFSTMDPGSVIDWIAIQSGQLSFEQYRVHKTILSDHRPVVATLAWPTQR